VGVDEPVSRRAAFLDRDGVINQAIVRAGKPYPPQNLSELVVLAGVPDAIARLRQAGYLALVVTNQPDVARGATSRSTVQEINSRLSAELGLDGMYVCWHDDADDCNCRKPRPGLLFDAAREHGVDLSRSFMIGDRWRDIAAGQRAGCRTIWIDRRYNENPPTRADYTTDGLPAAVEWILDEKEAADEDAR
jgi:D-glycero-D-manno-heptose 1,7-bisphosphate phosphatase